jgi:hypothetical protein
VKCRKCGCTDEQPCLIDHAGNRGPSEGLTFADDETVSDEDLEKLQLTPCSWIEADLCSACVEAPSPAALLYGPDGEPLHRGAP